MKVRDEIKQERVVKERQGARTFFFNWFLVKTSSFSFFIIFRVAFYCSSFLALRLPFLMFDKPRKQTLSILCFALLLNFIFFISLARYKPILLLLGSLPPPEGPRTFLAARSRPGIPEAASVRSRRRHHVCRLFLWNVVDHRPASAAASKWLRPLPAQPARCEEGGHSRGGSLSLRGHRCGHRRVHQGAVEQAARF